MKPLDPRGIYFASEHIGEPEYNYVCWMDVMGTQNQMLRSLYGAANFIFKLHCAVLEAREDLNDPSVIRLYPAMDGVYMTSERRSPLQEVVTQSLRRIVTAFMNEKQYYHQFLVRGAIAFGPVHHGRRLDPKAAYVLDRNHEVRDSILVGLPMVQAFQAEREAPPFGIVVHSSARGFAPVGDDPFRFIWLEWFRTAKPPLDVQALLTCMDAYFAMQTSHHNKTGYDPKCIAHHEELATEYFTATDAGGSTSA